MKKLAVLALVSLLSAASAFAQPATEKLVWKCHGPRTLLSHYEVRIFEIGKLTRMEVDAVNVWNRVKRLGTYLVTKVDTGLPKPGDSPGIYESPRAYLEIMLSPSEDHTGLWSSFSASTYLGEKIGSAHMSCL